MFLYWIDKHRFAGSSEPSLEDLPFLKTIEWGGMVSLQENSATDELATLLAVPFLHLPMQDFSVPSETDLEEMIDFFHECQEDSPKSPLLIHCTAGRGRTGTILASLLIVLDQIPPEEAIKRIRAVNPLAIETKEQEDFIKNL